MNFSQFANLTQTLDGVHGVHLSGGKFQGGGMPPGQVLLGGSDPLHFLNGGQAQPQLITLPISVAGKNDSDMPVNLPQTIQIQVVPGTAPANHNGAKFVMPIQIQGFAQGAATVLTLAYNQAGPGEPLQLQLQSQVPESNNNEDLEGNKGASEGERKILHNGQIVKEERLDVSEEEDINADGDPDEQFSWPSASLPLSLHHFLRFSADTIRREQALEAESPLSDAPVPVVDSLEQSDPKLAPKKRKRSARKKIPRPKKPRPGQVHIATALDGTTLFCCPECHMAYPDKELLEQHLVGHKIERRFICDTCGAGLKRKEHLERHKLGHNPERPFICPVCQKGFKRKEHLNLHSVIHSGSKSEVCMECGKGFYRKDHLRKHAKSHMTKKMKEAAQVHAQTILEAQQLAQTTQVQVEIPNMPGLSVIPITTTTMELPMMQMPIKTELLEEDEPEQEADLGHSMDRDLGHSMDRDLGHSMDRDLDHDLDGDMEPDMDTDPDQEPGDMPMDDDEFLSTDGLPDVSGISPTHEI